MTEPPAYPGEPHEDRAQDPGYLPPPPPQQPAGVPPPYGAAPVVPGSSKATTSLVLGIISILCCNLLGIVAIVLGKQATTEATAAGLPPSGNAKAGIILGWIALALMAIGLVIFGLFFAVGMAGGFDSTTY